jgi:ATP-dependent RNA helicase DHX8/PRP22
MDEDVGTPVVRPSKSSGKSKKQAPRRDGKESGSALPRALDIGSSSLSKDKKTQCSAGKKREFEDQSDQAPGPASPRVTYLSSSSKKGKRVSEERGGGGGGGGSSRGSAPLASLSASTDADASDVIQKQRQELPIYKAQADILCAVTKHDTLVLVGETGSGKTTQIPQFLHAAGFGERGLIACTQPRRVAATSVAARVAKEMSCKLGGLVGYAVRFDDKTTVDTRIKFMTDGMLLRELLLDPSLSRYAVILLDEAHERTLNTELLLALIKRLQAARSHGNRPLKVVVMSATLEAETYARFFSNPALIRVPGRRFPVQVLYTQEAQPDFLASCILTVLQIHVEEERGDILCFLTGKEQIDDAVKVLKERSRALPASADKLLPCPLYAQLPPSEQQVAFEPPPAGTRKVVLATNIAESSITIEGIRYVVDTGLVKSKVFEPKSLIESLHEVPISRAQCQQRTGRAGRVAAGKSYRLFTEEQFEELSVSAVPEIKRCRLASLVLQLKVLNPKP